MAVQVEVQTVIKDVSKYTKEDQFAFKLKNRFLDEFNKQPTAKGRVTLYTNITYGGGTTSESDILVVADLDGYFMEANHRSVDKKVTVKVQRGCWVLELKNHSADKIKAIGNILMVPYTDKKGIDHYKPISTQSRNQKFDLKNYFEQMLGYSPFIYNFLCFQSVKEVDLNRILPATITGDTDLATTALSREFTFEQLIQKTVTYFPDSLSFNENLTCAWFNCSKFETMMDDIKELYESERRVIGNLTQQKLDVLSLEESKKSLKNYKENKLNLFSGRAGTGKTIRLLQFAIDKESGPEGDNRCLLLTYNHALVADIKRLMFLTGHHAKLDGKTIEIRTLNSFFLEVMVQLGTRTDKNIGEPDKYFSSEDGYKKDVADLLKYVTGLSADDLAIYKELADCQMNWNYILIDEGQDWSDNEFKIIQKIYGDESIVFADGVDQFIRSTKKINVKELANHKPNEISGDICLRQKNNLVTFVNAFAEECGINWSVKENDNLLGGGVYIMKGYNTTPHKKLIEYCTESGAVNYDVLFLVPPADVKKGGGFCKYEKYEKLYIHLFDGTIYENRTRYPLVDKQCRLYQYESCRGLEGWAVICYDFDLLIEAKKKQFNEMHLFDPTKGGTEEEQRNEYAYLWSLMPLTRAIDRLYITLSDDQGEVANHLRNVFGNRNFKDFVNWL